MVFNIIFMKQIFCFKIILFAILLIQSCKPQKQIAGNYTFKTECLGIEMDGSQTVKAWGNGRNRYDAFEQAKKNAVNDVLFNGINEGKQNCEKRPLVAEVNARQKYDTYFNQFFTDGGEYKNFVSMKDERIGQKVSRDRKGARQSVTHGVIVRVLRAELKQKLIDDGILNR
jgi:hypothetical protein